MTRKEWILLGSAIVTCTSAVFGGMAYLDSRLEAFVTEDQMVWMMGQILDRLQSIEEALRSRG